MENLAQTDVNNIYLVVGILVVTNIGAIGGAVWLLVKAVWNAAKYDSRIQKMESDINAAHSKIRRLEGESEIR